MWASSRPPPAGGPGHAVRAHGAVRRPHQRPDALQRAGLLAARRGATTGATTPSSVCRPLPPIAICRACRAMHRWAGRSSATTSWRPPSCAAPATRCGCSGSHGQLGRAALKHHRLRGPRPALGPGQPAAHEGADHAAAALAEPPAHGDRHPLLRHLPDVVCSAGAQFHHHLPGGHPRLPVLRVRNAHAVPGMAGVPRRGDRRAAAGHHRGAAVAQGAGRDPGIHEQVPAAVPLAAARGCCSACCWNRSSACCWRPR